MSFHEIQFPASISFGSVGGPERRTDIVSLSSGFEERNTPWAHSRRHYDAGIGMRSLDDIATLISFFEARHGQIYGFRWKDWSDYKSCLPSKTIDYEDQVLGTGDGVTRNWSLVKTYSSGGQSYQRPIVKPVEGSIRVGIQGEQQFEQVHFIADHSTGVLQFEMPPAKGLQITAGYEFDVPVRFDTDRIQTSVASFKAGDVPNIPIIEVRI